jgi:hypothetical protein
MKERKRQKLQLISNNDNSDKATTQISIHQRLLRPLGVKCREHNPPHNMAALAALGSSSGKQELTVPSFKISTIRILKIRPSLIGSGCVSWASLGFPSRMLTSGEL